MTLQLLLAYSLITWLTAATPGPAVLLALRNGATRGFRAGLYSTLGNQIGLLLLAGASILGLGVILHTSAWLFTLVKWVGAAYLVYLGVRMLRSRDGLDLGSAAQGDAPPASDAQMFRLGLWVSLTNPKAILFFGALFPQFVQPEQPLLPQFATLVSLSMCASVSCLLTYVWLASHARRWLQRPRAARWINRVAGSVFIGFGVVLAGLRR
ncbi:LysE family translocator [Hydrogenophaga taeniospiralis]|jgi:homoserine/homoserine lactone efflux protein|uniref:LysE family translocator n=1 Tax=Hydrogenophaga taeniospiralis TaxID=65656 RepID=UPI001CF9D3D0|nr:LysE family translocator [Hydrogenophaga taeniospiralis]MCB4363584.1 LysE family translocator [Hydrogenophaga taeniospiralis]